MNEKLLKVVAAIDDCDGIEIPYPIAKKMFQVSQGLKCFMEDLAVEANKAIDLTASSKS